MEMISRNIDRMVNKLQFKLFLRKKSLLQAIRRQNGEDKKILLIVGCQRSGTTMMQRIFERDMETKVYGEFSKLSSLDANKIRINPLDQVRKNIEGDTPPIIILKPLVESQNLYKMFNALPGSKALWMYRHYKDVATSNLNNFGKSNGIDDLRPIANNEKNNWRNEGTSDELRAVIKEYFSEKMNDLDAAALFWYARNSLFFDLNLQKEKKVMMCRYNDLVYNPHAMMQKIYRFMESPFPGEKIVEEVSTSSVGKGKEISLHQEIETLCEGMLKKLDAAYASRKDDPAFFE